MTVLRPEEKEILSSLRELGCAIEVANRRNYAQFLGSADARPSLVLMRNVSRNENLRMAQLFEHAGIAVINSAASILTCSGKDIQALAFARHDIRHPQTRLAFTFDDVSSFVAGLGGDVVIKPVNSSWGRGVVRIRTEEQFAAWRAGWESVDARGREFPVIVQQHIPKADHDLRAIVIGTEVVVVIRRDAIGLRTNTALGGVAKRVPIEPEVRSLCAEVVAMLGPGFYGIDLVRSTLDGEYFVLEVNANPEFARSAPAHDVDIAGLFASYTTSVLGIERELAGLGAPS
ncbi:RimK family alpha-L-glutamate ligase [Nocardia sp. NPDC050793]|uniref:ATP-grasp domain-containing protein n=1 Tax=Nocardia sp. NPDC050793 TaxID=3155159 RepID=UPI003401B685